MLKKNTELQKFMILAFADLNHYELSSAISRIRTYLQSHPDAALSDALEGIGRTYAYMLHYLAAGQQDPERERLYSDIREDLYGIVRAIEYKAEVADSSTLYYNTARNCSIAPKSPSLLARRYRTFSDMATLEERNDPGYDMILKQREATLRDIFDCVWTIRPGHKHLIEEAAAIAADKETDYTLASLIIAALTMGALHTYDRDKLIALLDIDSKVSQRLGARTLAGILLILYRNARRLENDYTLRLRFETWTDNLLNYRRLREMVMVLVRTAGSLEMAGKLKNEVLPDIMKASPEIMEKLKNGEMPTHPADLEENPEWEEIINKSGLKEKLGMLEKLQREGADLMLLGLGRLKQMTFFNHISNWFLPFSMDRSEIRSALTEDDMPVVETVAAIDLLCDSDKYSFCLTLPHLPREQRRQMGEAMRMQQEQQSEEFKEYMLKSTTPEFDREALSYVRSIYRFFNFFRLKNEFESIIQFPFDFTSLPMLGNLLREREIVEMVAEYYFRNKYYPQALELFNVIADDCNEGAIYEKIGYCCLVTGQPSKALENFEKAELLENGSKWLHTQLARAASAAGEAEKAVGYYRLLLDDEPENVKLLEEYADNLMKLRKYDKALSALYKLDYLGENVSDKVAECRIFNGEPEKAASMLESTLDAHLLEGTEPEAETLLMAGHAQMGLGDISTAIKRYEKAAKTADSPVATRQQFRSRLQEDWSRIAGLDHDRNIIPLIEDIVFGNDE